MNSKTGLNFLSFLPGTLLTILTITVAFLRFYDQEDFAFLGQIPNPRLWSNRLTVAALVVAVVNFGVEEERPRGGFLRKGTRDDWNRRNRETDRLARENERRSDEERRRRTEATRAANERAEERERATRRARIQN